MKHYKIYLLASLLILASSTINAQTINWKALQKEDRHILNVNMGIQYGATFGLAYGYHLKTKSIPIVIDAEYSFPGGKTIFDDFKTKIGSRIRWIKAGDFQVSTNVQGVFRRYENEMVRLDNFGSDLSGVIGYYRTKWFIAGEIGFDKAIVTHFKHSQIYKNQYPGVIDGWYEPATGGNFYYGLQLGYSGRKYDIYVKAGKMLTQDFKTTPLLPVYGQFGFTMKW